ncbi:hypothetical protein GDO78_006056 [Eleutherodactylus coqui]|nr:hypothetical protein GDO78_006056 [Eleutherodactylus coqui]KAG9490512.1 hypothetical protein GDO78_006056 [Eleutherodactylus coqui]
MELGNEQRTLHTLTGVPAHELQAFSGMPANEPQVLHTLTGVPANEPIDMQMSMGAPDIAQGNLQEEPPTGKRKRGKAPAEPKPKKSAAKTPKPPKPPKAPKAPKAPKSSGKQEKITDAFKVKRKVDRFNGVSEAELLTKTLPDILTFNLDIVIIGINPGLMAAYKGHHYPGPGNHFYLPSVAAGSSFFGLADVLGMPAVCPLYLNSCSPALESRNSAAGVPWIRTTSISFNRSLWETRTEMEHAAGVFPHTQSAPQGKMTSAGI